MSRKDRQFFGMAVRADEVLVRYQGRGVISKEEMEQVAECPLVVINHGYDGATDSYWPTFRHPAVPPDRARDLIRGWNRENPESIFPSVPPPT